MSEKPQEAPRGEQEDFLEQVFTQGLDKMTAPARTAAAGEPPADETPPAPEQEGSEKAAPLAEKKNRRASVYHYLLVLFGAAFLMLLLAFFIQQRSSEDTISDLRDSMNLSRQELLDQIRELEDQNTWLEDGYNRLLGEYNHWKERYEEKDGELTELWDQYDAAQEELFSWKSFWELERCYQAGDYASCAAVMILQSQSQYSYHAPEAVRERQEEILQAVLGSGILDDRSQEHYDELLDAYLANHAVDFLPAGC